MVVSDRKRSACTPRPILAPHAGVFCKASRRDSPFCFRAPRTDQLSVAPLDVRHENPSRTIAFGSGTLRIESDSRGHDQVDEMIADLCARKVGSDGEGLCREIWV